MEEEESILEYNNKLLDCIIDICEFHPSKYRYVGIDEESCKVENYFIKPIIKFFSIEEIKAYKDKEQIIHDYKLYINDESFYKSLLDDFKLYMYKIIYIRKNFALLYLDIFKQYETIFNNNISFIYFYNFILFLKNISNKFPKIINEDAYKIDLILINDIFSPNYKVSFENGFTDKYGINYENYTILMVELIDLIKEKKYEGYNDIYEIEKFEFKYPNNWEDSINQVEIEIINFFLFKDYINEEIYNDKRFYYNLYYSEFPDYIFQIKKIYEKLKKNKNDYNNLNQRLDTIINNIIKSKSLSDKQKYIKDIMDSKDYIDNKLLNENEILSNIDILYDLYSLDENEFELQLIYSLDMIESFVNPITKFTYNASTFLDFVNNRKKIIQEIKNANNYTKEFGNILSREEFRNKIRIILSSATIKKYYKRPDYFFYKEAECYELIKNNKLIEIYENFLKNYIENDMIYENIIIKRMPYGIESGITSYLNFIIDPFGVDMNNNITNKEFFIETYLIILFLQETNLFSKRSYFMNQPLSFCKIPLNSEGGENLIVNILGQTRFHIIDTELSKKVNDINNWKLKDVRKIKEFTLSFKMLPINSYNEEKLIKLKNEQNCLICISNFRVPKKDESKINCSRPRGGGLICF